jgi:hypothetical protein
MPHPFESEENLFRELLRLDVPADRGFYVVDGAEAGPDFAHAGDNAGRGCGGYWHSRLCGLLKPLLVSQGRWTAPGFACILFNRTGYLPNDPGVCASIAHELAHAIDCQQFNKWQTDPSEWPEPDRSVTMAARIVAVEESRQREPEPDAPFLGHAGRFIRVLLHLLHRLNASQFAVSPEAMHCAGLCYGLSEWRDYEAALRGELHDRARERIVDILATDAPIEFEAIEMADMRRYLAFTKAVRGNDWPARAVMFDAFQRFKGLDDPTAMRAETVEFMAAERAAKAMVPPTIAASPAG